MKIEEIVNEFKKRGFEIDDISLEDGELAYTFACGDLRVGIFDHDYPNTGYCGSILVEYKDYFDKWSKVFYKSSFPCKESDFELLMYDLFYLTSNLNKKSSLMYGRLERTF